MGSRNTVWIVVVIVIVLLGGLFLMRRKDATTDTLPTATTTPTTTVATDTVSTAPKTPTVASSDAAAKRAAAAYTRTRIVENGMVITVIEYTDKGFVPAVVQIKRGENVRFVNKSNSSMRISSENYQGMPLVNTLGQERSVGKGGTFQASLSETGVWSYHNLDSEAMSGVIYVQE